MIEGFEVNGDVKNKKKEIIERGRDGRRSLVFLGFTPNFNHLRQKRELAEVGEDPKTIPFIIVKSCPSKREYSVYIKERTYGALIINGSD